MRPHRTHASPRRPRWRVALMPSAAALLTGAWISGCSVLYDLSTEQCSTDADCDALGGVFQGLACVEHLCQTPPGCQSHAECIDTVGLGGEPYACLAASEGLGRECVALRTEECPLILPQTNEGWLAALRTDNPLILAGTGVLTSGTIDELLRNYDLALTEINRNPGGLDGGSRPLVMLGCKANITSREELDRMMTHLAQTLKVPAMIAALYADDLQYAFQSYGQQANMFFMSPLESDPALATVSDSGLLWHIGPRPEVIARAYAPLLTRALQHLVDTAGVTAPFRVATVAASDQRFMSSMMTTIGADEADYGLSFNGGSAADNLNTGYLPLSVTLGEAASVEEVDALLEFKPHVIISAAGPEFYRNIIAGVEAGWNDSDGPRPFYILSPFNYNDPDSLLSVVTSNPGLRTRLAGVNGAAAEEDANYRNYLVAYAQQFGMQEPGYENYYDAAYYLMYAAGAVVRTSPLSSGEDFARGMRRLLGGGQSFDVGERDLAQGLAAVAGGASIALQGTLGPPNWNDNGTRDLPGSVYCIDANNQFVGDVLRYREATPGDASTVTLEGDFGCFPFGPE